MEYEFNEKLKGLAPYEPICGEYRIRLDANESFIEQDEETMKKIRETICAAPFNRYPDPYAVEICKLFADYCGVRVENVVAGNGSDEIISIIIGSFFCKGDKIAIFTPDFSMYNFYSYMSELEIVTIEKGPHMVIDVDEACRIINEEKIKGVFFSNPCSPTSLGMSADSAAKFARETKALVIVDEAYMDFYNESVISQVDKLKNLIVLKTCSKAFGLAGIRLGFAISNAGIINGIKAAKSPYNVNVLTQRAAKAVFSDPEKIKENIDRILESRDHLYKGIKSLEGGQVERVFCPNANFVFFKGKNGRGIYEYMKEKGIAVRQMGDYLRITAGALEENKVFLDALREMEGSL